MYAVEFETNITNGLVQIPTLFEKLQTSTKAKIIILVDEDNSTTATTSQPDFIEQLMDNPRPMNSSHFLSREEANAR
jgi:hypothetical protein